TRDSECAATETCILDPTGNGASSPTTHFAPACVPRRGGAAPGASCRADGDCDRGGCQLGVCVELCAVAADCHVSGMRCDELSALLDGGPVSYAGCLPPTATLFFAADDGVLPLPTRARSFALFVALDPLPLPP